MTVGYVLLGIFAVFLLGSLILLVLKRTTKETGQELIEAVRSGQKHKIAKLIRKNTNLNVRDARGRTPLMLAIIKGDTGTVRILLESGADILPTDKDNRSAMDFAKVGNKDAIVKLLKRHGAY